MNNYHQPVLLHEATDGLEIKPKGIYVDATFGGGGHSKEILKYLTTGRLIAFDQDEESLRNNIKGDRRFTMINTNFRNLKTELKTLGISHVDGLIADLGVSAYHFTDNTRGFSLQYNAGLDMRMTKQLKKDGRFILNQYDRKNLNKDGIER